MKLFSFTKEMILKSQLPNLVKNTDQMVNSKICWLTKSRKIFLKFQLRRKNLENFNKVSSRVSHQSKVISKFKKFITNLNKTHTTKVNRILTKVFKLNSNEKVMRRLVRHSLKVIRNGSKESTTSLKHRTGSCMIALKSTTLPNKWSKINDHH